METIYLSLSAQVAVGTIFNEIPSRLNTLSVIKGHFFKNIPKTQITNVQKNLIYYSVLTRQKVTCEEKGIQDSVSIEKFIHQENYNEISNLFFELTEKYFIREESIKSF